VTIRLQNFPEKGAKRRLEKDIERCDRKGGLSKKTGKKWWLYKKLVTKGKKKGRGRKTTAKNPNNEQEQETNT